MRRSFSRAAGIAEACKAISEKPKEYAGYNLLATALILHAQETFDAAFYPQAEDAVKKSLALSPNNFETRENTSFDPSGRT